MQRKASAVWKGGLKDGKGTVSSTSGVLSNTPYSFTTRFENTPGTNPEELIAAAHAACFSMALSAQLRCPMGDHRRASGCSRESARRKRGRVQHSGPNCQGRMPCVKGTQRQDHNGC